MGKSSWLESIYGLTEFYFWEPQHIFKQAKPGCNGIEYFNKASEKAHRLEVPLNICFNVLMRLLPGSLVASMCESAESSIPISLDGACSYIHYWDQIGNVFDYIQPDLVLESMSTRVYVELKVDAVTNMKQIVQYMYFHEEWIRRLDSDKQMVLLLISPLSLGSVFSPAQRESIFNGKAVSLENLQKHLIEFDTSQYGIGGGVDFSYLDSNVKELTNAMTIAHMTWNQVADHLEANSNEYLTNLIGDFVADIRRRKFKK